MGSYKWSYKSPNIGYNYSYLLIITTHEPPSKPQPMEGSCPGDVGLCLSGALHRGELDHDSPIPETARRLGASRFFFFAYIITILVPFWGYLNIYN